MVRYGVVSHPQEWAWVGYHEIMGERYRYRLLDLDRLCWRLGTSDLAEVRCNLEAALADAARRDSAFCRSRPCLTGRKQAQKAALTSSSDL